MKTKVKLILGIVDVLLILLIAVMLLFGGTKGKSAESKVSAKEVKEGDEQSEEVTENYLYDGVIDKIITVEAGSEEKTSQEQVESGDDARETDVSDEVGEATEQGRRKDVSPYNGNVEDDVKKIRAEWQKIQDNLKNYRKVDAGSGITHYIETVDGQDVIRKALVKNGGATEEYFYTYSNGAYEPFFVFVTGADKREDRHYYVDGQLIRWIEAKKGGTIHDLELENGEYTGRGENYLNRAYNNIGL